MKRLLQILVVSMVAIFALSCGGGAEIGEDCETAGDKDECVDDAICTNEDSKFVCYMICKEQEECGANETCNGIEGSNEKSCQPDA